MQDQKITKCQDHTGKERTLSAQPPNICPLCHERINPISIGQNFVRKGNILQLIWLCNSIQCGQLFIEDWQVNQSDIVLKRTRPQVAKVKDFSKHIKKISPEFVEIYNEALEAETQELSNIAGPGYRKAFEFLIKDYAKSLADEEEQKEMERPRHQ